MSSFLYEMLSLDSFQTQLIQLNKISRISLYSYILCLIYSCFQISTDYSLKNSKFYSIQEVLFLTLQIISYLSSLIITQLSSIDYTFFIFLTLFFFSLGFPASQTLAFLFSLTIFKIKTITRNYKNSKMKNNILILLILLTLLTLTQAGAPFINFNELHQAYSQFELNLILNQNRNTPIVLFQYSQNKTLKQMKGIIQNAFQQQPDIAFAVLIDCRQFSYDLNKTLAICKGFDQYLKTYVPKDEEDDQQKLDDVYFGLDFFSPNPTRIREKGHTLSKNHDHQNLRNLNVAFNGQYLAKIIRNQVPDLTTYIEDQRDLEDFLQTNSEFRISKSPKLLYFDQNLQSPLFIKKAAVRLDGWFKIGVTDSPRLATKFKILFDKLLLLQYDFQTKQYQSKEIKLEYNNELQSLLNNRAIKGYTQIRKPRDILLDFEHKDALIYNVSSLKQVNQLISHGRIILLEISQDQKKFQCQNIDIPLGKYEILFNYACLSRNRAAQLLTTIQINPSESWQGKLFFIDGSLKNTKLVDKDENMYIRLPQAQARQKVTTEKQTQLCIDGARVSQKQPLFFYFNDRSHAASLYLMRYFVSIDEVSSLLYFCQFILPDQRVISQFQLAQNTIFTLTPADKHGQSQKVQHTKVQEFVSIKMFMRQIGINRILRAYEQKIITNEIPQIKSAQDLTQKCFGHKCIIALIETNTFHQSTQTSMLKEMQIAFSDEPFKYYWIDGNCHFQVGRQLKLTPKGGKFIEKSFLFLYNEKSYEYALWKGNKINKFWLKKDVFRWVKSLRNPSNVSKVKFGIDFQDRKCERKVVKKEQISNQEKPQSKQEPKKQTQSRQQPKKVRQVNPDEL